MSVFIGSGRNDGSRKRRWAPRRFFGRKTHAQVVEEEFEHFAKTVAEAADEESDHAGLHQDDDPSKPPLTWEELVDFYVDIFENHYELQYTHGWKTDVKMDKAKARRVLQKHFKKNSDGTWSVSSEGEFESEPVVPRVTTAQALRDWSDDDDEKPADRAAASAH